MVKSKFGRINREHDETFITKKIDTQMKDGFIKLKLGSHVIVHGFDENNKEIIENIITDEYSEKLVAINRIKSIGEKFVLTDYVDGRWIYWEYEGSFQSLEENLKRCVE